MEMVVSISSMRIKIKVLGILEVFVLSITGCWAVNEDAITLDLERSMCQRFV
jgi:hypothetical protein